MFPDSTKASMGSGQSAAGNKEKMGEKGGDGNYQQPPAPMGKNILIIDNDAVIVDSNPRLTMYLPGYGGPPPAYSSHASAPPPAQAGGELPPAYSAAPDNTLVGASAGPAHPQVKFFLHTTVK